MSYRKPCGSVVEAIGNTPLVRLRRVVENLPVEAFASFPVRAYATVPV